jgi:hypothetical protein
MDLAKFLADRLDEDASAAEDVHSRDCDTMTPPGFPCDCRMPARMLREVEAKRKILADLDLSYPDEEHLLRLLAAIYENHEDYDPAWKET